MMTTVCQVSIDRKSIGERLDVFLTRRLATEGAPGGQSRAEVQRLIAAGRITLNGATTKPSVRLKMNDRIDIQPSPARETSLRPEALPLEILYEDADCLVINKEPGIVVHPAAGHTAGTLVNALLYHCRDLAGIGGERRPGIVHRLDRDTSGLLMVARHDAAQASLMSQLKARRVKKTYLALVQGNVAAAHLRRQLRHRRTRMRRPRSRAPWRRPRRKTDPCSN